MGEDHIKWRMELDSTPGAYIWINKFDLVAKVHLIITPPAMTAAALATLACVVISFVLWLRR